MHRWFKTAEGHQSWPTDRGLTDGSRFIGDVRCHMTPGRPGSWVGRVVHIRDGEVVASETVTYPTAPCLTLAMEAVEQVLDSPHTDSPF